jgi:cytochrome c oxidase assembly protein subunit 15/protoheme IX farnesyltransferase
MLVDGLANSPDANGDTLKPMNRSRAFERFAWSVLAFAVLVIVWGAVVRATGSGAGCGQHWPLCNGEVVPPAPTIATIIEFGHRVSSGLILILTVALVAAAWRTFPRAHPARRAAGLALIFVAIEAAIGAGIVLLQLVERNASALRAGYVALHLVNTMFLAGALTATAWSARPRATGWPEERRVRWSRRLTVGLAAVLVVAAAGAVVALGDTLFPQATLAAGLAADFDPASHALTRLRVWHPALAVVTSGYLIGVLAWSDAWDDRVLGRPARFAIALIAGQLVVGAVNLLTLAPLTLQMAHLLVSNALWVMLVWIWLTVRARVVRRAVPGSRGA